MTFFCFGINFFYIFGLIKQSLINTKNEMNKETQQILDSLKCRAKTMQYTVIFNQLKQLEKTLKTETK